MKKRSTALLTAMGFGYAFLYVPIVILIVSSFNYSQLTQKWGGFSFRWYVTLFNNPQLLHAAFISFQIATISATLALILGTMVAVIMTRYKTFKGRGTFNLMVSAPLVMPDIITALGLLLMFLTLKQTLGWPDSRGIFTITCGHATVAMAYVVVVIKSRLLELDRSLEEAALDLGAKPGTVFWHITLPIIRPALISSWLLAFTLSLDDVVIASFLAGPGSTTLPMMVFSSIKLGMSPQINALATIIVCIVTIGVIIAGLLISKHRRQQQGN